jgi:hypothetical protein
MEYDIIQKWDDVTVSNFIHLTRIKKEDFVNDEDYLIAIISILSDLTQQELENIEYDIFVKIVDKIEFINTLPSAKLTNKLFVNQKVLDLNTTLNSLTIGEFIDLEYFFSQNYYENLPSILAILYRFYTEKDDWFEKEIEPYGNYIFKRAPYFNQISINKVYGVIDYYLKWRTDLFEKYEGLFKEVEKFDDEEIDKNQSHISRAEEMKERKKQESFNKWSWNLFLYQLSNNDPLKMNQASGINVIEAFNILSMKKELAL